MAEKTKPEAVATAVLDDDLPLKPVEAASAEASIPSVLSEQERKEARAEAVKQFYDDRKKKLRKKAVAAELAKLRAEHGNEEPLGGGLDDLVTFKLNLPENADRILINQRIFTNGEEFTVPRHVFNSIAETIWRAQVAEHNLSGKKRESFYRGATPVLVSREGAVRSDQSSTVLQDLVQVA